MSQGFGAKKKMEETTVDNKTDQQRINFRLRIVTLQITELFMRELGQFLFFIIFLNINKIFALS